MRCEECRALVEEYFDGELERAQGERVGAHLSACADCAAALDALSFEQEMYLRYERELEVSPALWQNVRAAVARPGGAGQSATPLPLLGRLRERLAASPGVFAPRAAFASALALLVVGVLLGALWLANTRGVKTDGEVVSHAPVENRIETGGAVAPGIPKFSPVENGDGGMTEPHRVAPPRVPSASTGPTAVRIVNAGGAPARHTPSPVGAAPPAADHLAASENDLLPLVGDAPGGEADVVLAAGARLLTPEEKGMARHLEQAQMLLRSFQNAGAAEGGSAQLAYERRLSRRLLEENATLQLEADTSGDEGGKQVLDTLEPFLLDIANLRDNASRDEVRSIRERMKKKEIIAALHVY